MPITPSNLANAQEHCPCFNHAIIYAAMVTAICKNGDTD